MPGILLQNPCQKVSSKKEYLTKKLDYWDKGDFKILLKEGIQKTNETAATTQDYQDQITKIFTKNMLQRKVHAALRAVEKSTSPGVAIMTDQTLEDLEKLHPHAKDAEQVTRIQGEVSYFDHVVFSNINL